ncbi:hypothetical protein NA56DRAFT_592638 [Hyaloscypha hepaticicola]|uniref:2EXR domain-containing protein n=1 Tax=Hyaloscypha hepaticicola TaxID=2082293 RepID=A0A2J6QHK4_9HELO|nr:hypothetical protein NA56DRAFT_592638 [Hyaloscypha hepaticicola]
MELPYSILDRCICHEVFNFPKDPEEREMITSTPPSSGYIQFPKFLKRPTEIRLSIWRCSFPSGCYVRLHKRSRCPWCHLDTWSAERQWRLPIPNDDQGLGLSHCGKQPGPQTLSACKEAREETLQHYITLFEEEPSIPTVLFSPEADILSVEYYYGQFLIEFRRFSPKTKEQLKLVKGISLGSRDLLFPNMPLQDEFWAYLKGAEELIFYDTVLCPWDVDSIQEKLKLSREQLTFLQNQPGGFRIHAKSIKCLTFDHVLHE